MKRYLPHYFMKMKFVSEGQIKGAMGIKRIQRGYGGGGGRGKELERGGGGGGNMVR